MLHKIDWILIFGVVHSLALYEPRNFPLELNNTVFDTWADDNYWNNTWTAYPETAEQVVKAANWAYSEKWQLRASGEMHTWAPFTVPNANPSGYPTTNHSEPAKTTTDGREWRMVLLKTEKLNRMGIISNKPGNMTFWAEPGIKMLDLLTQLEQNGMGLLSHPAPGAITLGGVLAIGGHGAAVRAVNEKLSPGHSYGSLSNLVVSLTAVVYDKTQDKFVLKTFDRTDPQTKVFLVSLGRAFIVRVVMRAGPLQYLRCQSYTDISVNDLFAHPSKVTRGQQTFSSFLDKSGRVESILFAFTRHPWLKVWTLTDKNGPRSPPLSNLIPGITSSKKVNSPYNYPFSDNMSPAISEQVQQIKNRQYDFLARSIGLGTYTFVTGALATYQAYDLWGVSKNVLLYIKPTTLKYHANGYAILTSRANIQLVMYQVYTIYQGLMDKYEKEDKYPINGPLEMRVSGIDDPLDVLVPGAESPSISATSPIKDRKEFDTVLWVNVLTYTRTAYTCHFMIDMEGEFFNKFNGTTAQARVEWSKGWAYTTEEPWKDANMLYKKIPAGFSQWEYHRKVSGQFAAVGGGYRTGVFNNQFFHSQLFQPAKGEY